MTGGPTGAGERRGGCYSESRALRRKAALFAGKEKYGEEKAVCFPAIQTHATFNPTPGVSGER